MPGLFDRIAALIQPIIDRLDRLIDVLEQLAERDRV
jgi:hypothetical protein